MAMNISLPPELENRVRQRVATGLYGSASEVVREALRLMDAHEENRQQLLSQLKADIQAGLNDMEAGRVHEADLERIKAIAKVKQHS